MGGMPVGRRSTTWSGCGSDDGLVARPNPLAPLDTRLAHSLELPSVSDDTLKVETGGLHTTVGPGCGSERAAAR